MASASATIHRFGAIIERLSAIFPAVDLTVVERSVVIAVNCAEHLGYSATDDLVERLVTEHLRAKTATLGTLPRAAAVTMGDRRHARPVS